MKTLRTLCFCTAFVLTGSPAFAANDSELAALKASMLDMLSRIEALEAENQSLKAATSEPTKAIQTASKPTQEKKPNWAEKIALKGDIRYRYEGFDIDGRSDRSRNRVRARLQANAKVTDDVKVTIGLTSGSDDPVSANQTLGGGASTKGLRMDLAYFTWDISEDWQLRGGKYKNNFYKPSKSELIFDGDYTPEGFALSWSHGSVFAHAGYQWLESDSGSNNEMGLFGIQGGFKTDLAGGRLTAGLGFYNADTEGHEVFFGDPDDFFGNSFTCAVPATLTTCEYDEDYDMTQVFGQWSGTVANQPMTFFAEYIKNQAASDRDTAWAIGASIGKASTWNTWQFDYRYQDIERDAVFGLITGSDFGGGGTGHDGHIFKGGFGIKKGWTVGLAYFANENNLLGSRDFNRVQVDTQFKF